MLNEVLFLVGEFLPVGAVLAEVDFFWGPESADGILIGIMNFGISGGKIGEAVGLMLQEGFRGWEK